MVERPPSRFKLKRSTSVDSIQTGLNNLIARMHKSQLMQMDTLNDGYDPEDDCFFDVSRKADPVSSLWMKKEPLFLSGQKRSNRNGIAVRNNVAIRDENLSKEELCQRSPRRSTSYYGDYIKHSKKYGQDDVNYNVAEELCKTRSPRRSTSYDGDYFKYSKECKQGDANHGVTTEEPRIRSSRRSTSYDGDHVKRENERKQAREIAANLVRANKVKKELYDGNKSFNTISHEKKSAKILNRRNTSAGNNTNVTLPASTTTTDTCPTTSVSSSKIRLHTTTTSIPTTTQGTLASRSSRHQTSPEKGMR